MNETGINPPSGVTHFQPACNPSIGDAFREGWHTLWERFPILLLGGLIYVAISLAVEGVFLLLKGDSGVVEQIMWSAANWLVSLFVLGPLAYGLFYFYLRVLRREDASVEDIFTVFTMYGNVLLANILVAIITVIGFVFLIIPGIILYCKLAFVPYLVIDRKMGAIEAIRESWSMTRGHAGNIFLIGLLSIPIMIVGILALVVGMIPAMMWIGLALTAYYSMVDRSLHPKPSTEFDPIRAV